MQAEIEAKFLGINPKTLRVALEKNNATLVHPERLMKRKTFDYPDRRLNKIGGWVRVRDEGATVTFSYKCLKSRTINGTKEICVVVDSFNTTCDLLLAIGLDCKSYQETKRERWMLGEVEVTIDTWPWVPIFVELEGVNEGLLKDAVSKLNLDWAKGLYGSVEIVYQTYYNVSEEEVDSWENITFISVPDWLEVRKK